MPILERAKQFLPFSALTGLEEALRAKELEIEQASTVHYVHDDTSTDVDIVPDLDTDPAYKQ